MADVVGVQSATDSELCALCFPALQTLRAAGYVTLMCCDGTNDVGGLKAAHVGVALLAPNALAEQKVSKAFVGSRCRLAVNGLIAGQVVLSGLQHT